ncbi:CHAT domain-containing protein [Sphingomonas sabuli]|nr:CHAT domain-containing protein [Sphingomonas sabuli]
MVKPAVAAVALASFAWAIGVWAAPISVRDSFRIGSAGSSYCSAQPVATDPALVGMFDAGYAITCRDAALPVGKLYLLRSEGASARLAGLRTRTATCKPAGRGAIEQLGEVSISNCTLNDVPVTYRTYEFRRGNTLYIAEGLAGYDSALRLGLRSLVADAAVDGEVSIAMTGAGDPAAFARVQAGTLDPTRALSEAYRRNNVGSYADAAEFFAAVGSAETAPISRAEALINEALQKSNLGRFQEADALFARADEQVFGDPIDGRRLRNYRAMHLLNQSQPDAALVELAKPMPAFAARSAEQDETRPSIDSVTSQRLNSEAGVGQQLGGASDDLTPEEKGEILDGQALQLRGTSLRLQGNFGGARDALGEADTKLAAVRGGRVASIAWMRSQIVGDLGALAEQTGNIAEADRQFRQAVIILETNYPGSAALLNARARFAGHLARSGNVTEAETVFREIVKSHGDASTLPPSFARVLRPYVDILLKDGATPAEGAEIFAATQLMMRPGLAQTQAILARELNGGTGEASRLFRQAVSLTRQVERTRISLTRMEALATPTATEAARTAALRVDLDTARKAALATQSSLADYPRYRAVTSDIITLDELQKALRPGEAYYRMTVVDEGIYAFLATPTSAGVVKLPVTAGELEAQVKTLRESIVTVERGQQVTYAYDIPMAHKLYGDLFAPFAAEIARTKHLIFEPDGAMLRMPANALITDRSSVDRYAARVAANPDSDFDFTGLAWLGRDRDVSTAVSPRSFVSLRNAPPSAGDKAYLGLGHNSVPAGRAAGPQDAIDVNCMLPLASWQRPISARELKIAGDILAREGSRGVDVVTGDAFTDTAIEARDDLKDYRIIHFATHGVVTAPRPQCPTQPALLTSFGPKGSDGLLTFREIFDLDLDADVVILSACDTAGTATAVATQSAGLATGGDVALDGLVRAFVGAGGRLVVASHWPVPDDFSATERLVAGLFAASPGTPTVTAMRLSQAKLMDDADTSHPFYWAAFAIVGDGEAPLVRSKAR